MKIIVTSIALLSFPHFIQSLRFGLLRIVESNVGSTNKKQSSVADFRSLFDEDVKFNVRGLFGESLSLSLSMSLPLPRGTPSSIFSNPTAVPTISVLPTFTNTPISSPVSNPTANDTITDSTVASDEDIDTSATGNVTSPIDTPKRSKNIAMIVVGSCALVAFVAMIAKKLTSPPSKGSSPLQLLPKGSSTAATATASIHDSSSNDVSSVGSSSVSGTSHANHDVQL